MFRASWQYLKDETYPRLGHIVAGSELWIAIGVGILAGFFADQVIAGSKTVDSVAGLLLTYASIAFGFCLAGLTVALTLPDPSFTRKLARSKRLPKQTDAYSDLLFVFSWTAICHWLIILVLIVLLVVSGPTQTVLPASAGCIHRIAVALVVALTVYAILQFLITLITLSQVGRAYIESLASESGKG